MTLRTALSFSFACLAITFVSASYSSHANAATATSSESMTVLRKVEVDGTLKERYVATVTLNTAKETITVSILDDICGTYSENPVAHACLAMPIQIESFALPITKTIDSCGTALYEAGRDLRAADGLLVEIKYTDYSNTICEMYLPGLQVLEVETVSPRGNTRSYYAVNAASKIPSLSKRDDEAIYNALNVEEVVLNPGIAGSSRTQKSVGGLTCTKSLTVIRHAKPTYTCSISN